MDVQNGVRSASLRWLVIQNPRDFIYYTPPGTPSGEEGVVPVDIQSLAVGNAITSILGSVGYVGPDQDGAPSVHGPAGPYIRDALIGLTVAHLASSLTDRELGRALQASALEGIAAQVRQMQQNLG